MIDLDHNATTPLHPDVAAAMARFIDEAAQWGNPSSIHGRGRAAREALEDSRAGVAAALGARAADVIFCGGGTEADNLAVLGCARGLRAAGAPAGVLCSPLEHPAVLACVEQLRREGHQVGVLPVDRAGRIEPAAVAESVAARPEIGLVSLAAANHELGNSYDIAGVVAAVRAVRKDVRIHCDAVQAFGKTAVDFSGWGVDLLSVSSHKIFGPAGAGALCQRPNVTLSPLVHGGGQERGHRAGTEASLLIQGFAVASALATREYAQRADRTRQLRTRLVAGLVGLGARLHGDLDHHVGNTINAAFPGVKGELLAINLDLEGFAVSTGAACSSGAIEPSPVLLALGYTRAEAEEGVRFSLGPANTTAEIDDLLRVLPPILARVRVAEAEAAAP